MANKSIWILSALFSFLFFALSTPLYRDSTFFRLRDDHVISGTSGRERVLLLTAHPDDECMFFAPTLLALNRNVSVDAGTSKAPEDTVNESESRAEVYTLCLSSGNADGLGEIRKRELEGSLDVLGVKPERRRVLDEPFHDNITVFWDADLIAEHVKPFIEEHNINVVSSALPSAVFKSEKLSHVLFTTSMNLNSARAKVLTFDEYGISSHPNHISLERGVRTLRSRSPKGDIRAFSLNTMALLPKYTGAAAVLFSKLEKTFCTILPALPFLQSFPMRSLPQFLEFLRITDCTKYGGGGGNRSDGALFVSGWSEYATTLRAMQEHRSQLVWFRWLYVTFSRYMWVNEWKEIVLEFEP